MQIVVVQQILGWRMGRSSWSDCVYRPGQYLLLWWLFGNIVVKMKKW